MSGGLRLIEEHEFDGIISGDLVLVDFYADWCGPCKMMTPILQKLAQKWEGKAVLVKVDVERAENVARKFQISSIPTLLLFSKGKLVGTLVGLRDEATIDKFLSQH